MPSIAKRAASKEKDLLDKAFLLTLTQILLEILTKQ